MHIAKFIAKIILISIICDPGVRIISRIKPCDSCTTNSVALKAYEDYNQISECMVVSKISRGLSDNNLFSLYKSTTGANIDSLGTESWVLNFWYGGSYEDIFVYIKKDADSYSRVLSLYGTISFKVLDTSDNGLKRILIKNNRTKSEVVFFYNGTDYSNYYSGNIQKSLNDPAGVEYLKKLTIGLGDEK